MKRNSAHLDEMQEGKLLKIEEKGAWLGFWGLLATILVQLLAGAGLAQVAGEAAALALLSGYIAVMSLRHGLWMPAAPSARANALASLAPAAAVAAILALKAFAISRNAPGSGLLGQLAASAAVVYAGCFAALEAMRFVCRRRRDRLDGEGEAAE